MEHAGGGRSAHAAVEEEHLPGAPRVEDESAGIHGEDQSFEIAFTFY
jgi:hypothetical protein